MTNYNLWDMSVWEFFFTLTILFAAMIVANALIRGIKPLRKMLIPASVLGGFLLLIVFTVYRKVTGEAMVSSFTLEMLTYHGLGIGCTALALKGGAKEKNKHAQRDIFNSALVTTSSYCLQAFIGLAITFALALVIKSVYAPSGMLVPMGYGQGPGQAYNWGHTYEQSWGFANGTSFGLTVSSVGFIACSIGGVIFLNVMRKKGNRKATSRIGDDVVEEIKVEDFAGRNDVPMSDSLDKLTIECAVVFITYAIAFGFTFILSKLCDMSGVNLLISTVKPLLWGFNFIFAALGAVVTKKFIGGLEKKQVIKKKYINDLFMDRVSGVFFDLMIVASISAINLEAFKRPEFVLPITVTCLAAGIGTYFFVQHATKKLFPTYSEESFLVMYGMLTGVVGTGIILLRQIDPKFETPASNNVVFQTLWACLTGFPLLLLMGFVPRPGWVPIALGILLAGFLAFYLWIRLAAKKVAKDM
ncbi:MAG: sodium/glutamate symporter [Bacillota bacterium]|nr:sodium/glutamate symporter [Bacillota bacterium]